MVPGWKMVSPFNLIWSSVVVLTSRQFWMHIADLLVRPFKCTCMHEFIQESAYTKHQQSCVKGKKWLFSVLSKAKDLLDSTKQLRLDCNHGTQDACVNIESSSTLLCHLQTLSLPSNQVNETLSTESSHQVLLAGSPTLVVPYSSSQGNMPILTSTPNLGLASAEIDDGVLLAQRRTRCVDVRMRLHYWQHEDVLPQPPPSVPSQATLL
jgi:hypothetical protein